MPIGITVYLQPDKFILNSYGEERQAKEARNILKKGLVGV